MAEAICALRNGNRALRAERRVRVSRARIQAAADAERRRLENDLHDGAQQRLTAIQIKLALVAETLDDPAAELLRTLQTELEDAIEEIRSLTLGTYPPALERHGLVDALRLVATRSPLPISFRADGVGRYAREIETAAYFCCLEAIQNATKHARDANTVVVELTDAGALRLTIRDDGAGFDAALATTGRGLTNMYDRLDGVGGHLTIESQPGHGTCVIATIPLPIAAPRAAA